MMAQPRTYRGLARRKHLTSFRVIVKETDLFVHARRPLEAITRELVLKQRGYIEAFISQNPGFLTTLQPMPIAAPAPQIVRDMAAAGEKAGVGPMAAVAGAIAAHVGTDLCAHSTEVIVENGGDVFIRLNAPFTAAIFAGNSPLSMKIGLRIDPKQRPIAVCTSSGTVGHSLSLGTSDAVCVVSKDCALADAAATAVGNHLRSERDIPAAIDIGKQIRGVDGLVVIVRDQVGLWGDLQVVPLQGKKG